jgi:hypothetical protein
MVAVPNWPRFLFNRKALDACNIISLYCYFGIDGATIPRFEPVAISDMGLSAFTHCITFFV